MRCLKNILKVIFLLGLWAIFVVWPTSQAIGNMSNYCSTPPFVSTAISPNVLIVLDNSGSMNDQAYAGSYDPTQFTSGQYYGYFDPTQNYIYSNNNRWEITALPLTSGTTANPIASGNFLNWATMRRVDAAKKLLIGGKANPRSVPSGQTVKLLGEDASSYWNFQKNYDTSAQNLVYPFEGDYRFSMSGDQLSISPVNPGTQTETRLPTSDIANGAWVPNSGTSRWTQVDDAAADGDTTYIQNTTSNSNDQVILGYDKSAFSISGAITDVTIVVRAKRIGSGTRRIQGVIRVKDIAGVDADFPSNYSNLTTSYSNYQFSWSTNPQTGLPWTWNDLTTSGINSMTGFGVKAYTQPTSTQYPRVTQIYMIVTVSNPSGGPYSIIIDTGGTDVTGIIDNLSSDVRFGLAYYNQGCSSAENCSSYTNGNRDGGEVNTYINFGSTTSMGTSIENMSPSTWTPLAETLYEMVRYFRQDSPYYTGNSPADYQTGLNYDPYYYNYSDPTLTDQYIPCAKSFILLLTDGESTMDKNIPATYQDYDNDGNDPAPTSSPYSTDYLDDVALWARTEDARPGSCTSTPTSWQQCIPGTQNIYLYPVFMFGQGSQLLKDAAINGGFNDLDSDNEPDCTNPAIAGSPTQAELEECYRDSDNNGTLDPSLDTPLTYYEGNDGYALEESITAAIADILRRAASGSAVSVLTTSSRGIGSMVQAYFLPTRQEGVKEITWTGYLQNMWIDPKDNLREDTVNDYSLRLDQDNDKVMKLYFDTNTSETTAALFTTDANGENGTLASCPANPPTKLLADITYLWEGGRKLALRPPSERTIFTSTSVIRGTSEIYDFTGENTFTSSNITNDTSNCSGLSGDRLTLCNTLGRDADSTAAYDDSASNIVRYIRGECLETGVTGDTACGSTTNSTYRDRRVTVNSSLRVWKLGDIISSTPKVFANTPLNTYHIDYSDYTYYQYVASSNYKQHSAIAFVGANDGMLHAFRVGYLKDKNDAYGNLGQYVKALFKDFFNVGDTDNDELGEEVWAYIPFNAFPYLKYLANPAYCHIYFNDLSVRLVDASINGNPTDTRTQSSWKTILIGGMRFGGACSGADATPAGPPTEITTDGIGDEDGICESGEACVTNAGFSAYFAIDITDPENPVSLWEFSDTDLGYTTTYPSIVRTGATAQNGNWYIVLGSGTKQLPKGATDIARTTTGYVYILNLETGALVKKIALDHNAIVADILAIDAEKDYIAEKIYFGTAYKVGSTWKGNLVTIDIPTVLATAGVNVSWDSSFGKTLFTDSYPFTASPDAAKDANGNIWVYEGSGKYYSDVDKVDNSTQIFFGLMDRPSGITYPLTLTNLSDRTNVSTTGTVTGTTQMCLPDPSSPGVFSLQDVVTSVNPTSSVALVPTNGWYITLSSLERVITRPLAVGGLVDFLTYKTNSDICSTGGDSYLYSLGYTTGVAPVNVAILSPGATGGTTAGNVTIAKGIKLGPGAPPTGEAIIIPPPKEGQETLKKKIQIATGVIVEAENEPTNSIISKILHWLRK